MSVSKKSIFACVALVAVSALFFSCKKGVDKSNPDSYFRGVVSQRVSSLTAEMEKASGALPKSGEKFGGELTLSAELSSSAKDIIGLIGAAAGMDLNAVDLSWLKNVSFDFDFDKEGSNLGLGVDGKLNGSHVISALVAMDFEKNNGFIQIPEVYKKYFMAKENSDLGDVETALNLKNFSFIDLKVCKKLIDGSIDALLSGISGVEKTEETVEISSESKIVNSTYDCLTVTLDSAKVDAMVKALNEYLKTSKDIDVLLKWASSIYGFEYSPEQKTEGIDGMCEALKEVLYDLDGVKIAVYADDKAEMAGIRFYNDEISAGLKTVLKGSDYGWELAVDQNAASQFSLSGICEWKNSRVTGDLTGRIMGQEAFVLSLKDYSMTKVIRDGSLQQVAVSLNGKFFQDVLYLESSETALMNMFTLVLQDTSKKDKSDVKILIANKNYEPFLTFAATSSLSGKGSVKFPAEADCLNIEDDQALESAVTEMNFKEVAANLRTAGLPEMLATMVESVSPADFF
ncbi:MAG: hypothetical protein K5839_07310 [Treponemataceae bacterium]|nr:hypothetical protein [Treponemataceae bacterium]